MLLNNAPNCKTQSSLTISGQVTASGNSPVAEVTVLLSGNNTRVVRSDVNGNYSFSNLTPGGNYSVTVQNAYFVFSPSQSDFFNLSSDTTVNLVAAPAAVPTPSPSPSDDFGGDTRDPNKWNLSTLTLPAGAFDPRVTTAQLNGELVITPLAQAGGLHYNGYITARAFDLRNGQVSVELVRAATGGADTIFGIGSDSDNFLRFVIHTPGPATGLTLPPSRSAEIEAPVDATTAQLILQVKINGQLTALNLDYSPEQHRFLRFRHEPLTNSLVFEASPDSEFCSLSFQKRVVVRKAVTPSDLSISTLIAELSAGTSVPTNPGVAKFDNFDVVTTAFQFNARGYTVTEGVGSALITVMRTGNSETAASVDFTTADGTAQQGNKYLSTAGKLTFLSGETSKSFSVPIVNNLVAEKNQTLNLLLLNPTASGLSATARALLTIIDDDTQQPTENPLDDVQFFVNQQYLDFLDRQPDAGGLDYWTTQIAQCGNNPQCIKVQRINVSAAFLIETEFQETGSFVYRMFKGALRRMPRYAEFITDRARVVGGANLRANKTALLNEFVQRTEFKQFYACSLSNFAFVNMLFDNAGLSGFEDERTQQVEAMNAGKTRAQVVGDVIELRAFMDQERNPAFVLMQYFGYLRRDVDPGGYAFWLDVLNNRDPNNYHAMVCAFVTSVEYQHRFSPVATHRNDECLR